jgi:hypothetical protein
LPAASLTVALALAAVSLLGAHNRLFWPVEEDAVRLRQTLDARHLRFSSASSTVAD